MRYNNALFVTMLVTLIKYCNGPCHASLKIVTATLTLYFLACGNDNNGNGWCNGGLYRYNLM